ncbi:hydroxylase [Enhygromyxa salina]|uniref:Hydroxylase n=1 Tax=Enhygromyxa salina TaxID=215803 RepID=A0A0C2CYA3_9BACT|nr:NAD(P)/FAD-dependent oxidoreductase [Enhygromyxa salina]KIG12807.1 hydroxylase [Enhygromyxa salina]
MDHNFDVIIVGGRPAGASLAARLGRAGLRVLVLDKSSFPSRPAVSAPFVLPHTLALLDELDLDEAQYAADTPKLERLVLEFGSYFRAHFRFDEPVGGRQHFYAVDRARFDACLWDSLGRYPSVTALARTRVLGLLRDEGGRVCGVRASLPDHDDALEFRAGCVIGADGRHSLVAREVQAPVIEERSDLSTTLYYAHWEGVADYGDGIRDTPAQIHSSCDGFSFVLMPSADAQYMVIAQGRGDSYNALKGSPDAVYDGLLRARPQVWRRLAGARQVGELRGLKKFDNLFRQARGPGWALVGDAYHQKDSLDAQGIYDALLSAKLLADALIGSFAGERELDAALASYANAAHAALAPMFAATMDRVQREIYEAPPPFVARTLLRWVLTHERYARRFMSLVTRRREPAGFLTPPLLLGLAASGAAGRVASVFRAGGDPTDPLPGG